MREEQVTGEWMWNGTWGAWPCGKGGEGVAWERTNQWTNGQETAVKKRKKGNVRWRGRGQDKEEEEEEQGGVNGLGNLMPPSSSVEKENSHHQSEIAYQYCMVSSGSSREKECCVAVRERAPAELPFCWYLLLLHWLPWRPPRHHQLRLCSSLLLASFLFFLLVWF